MNACPGFMAAQHPLLHIQRNDTMSDVRKDQFSVSVLLFFIASMLLAAKQSCFLWPVSYLVLVQYHVRYPLFDWKSPSGAGTYQEPLDKVNVEQDLVQTRHRRVV